MALGTTQFGTLAISRFILGGNPFSGFSHQNVERDQEMRHYFTTARIKQTMRHAEALGITTVISRTDSHVLRLMLEYRDEGGAIQWIAQTCPELGAPAVSANQAIKGGARACYIHGGQMDYIIANERYDDARRAIDLIRAAGLPAGVAGHTPKVFAWAEEHLDVDFYMCSYYNPTPREQAAGHVAGAEERFETDDRDRMVATIAGLSRPAIHYKVLAAGRTAPGAAFAFVAQHLRPQDAVCVGIYDKDHPTMLEENLRLLEDSLAASVSA